MKVVFLQDIMFEYLGPMYISAVLKEGGHEVDMIIPEDQNYIKQLKDADLIALSCMSSGHQWYLEQAKKIKEELDVPIVFGGPHPTFFPEMIKEPQVDYICVGEGEHAMLDLANALEQKKDTEHIPNIWTKNHKNEIRPLPNIDELPFPDRSIFYKYKFLRKMPTKKFITGRGCPYQCTFCYNHKIQEMYRGKGKFIRKIKPERAIEEIKEVRKKYPLKTVRFSDDTFAMNREWLKEFLELYKKEIDLPFSFLFTAGELNEKLTKLTKEAGCISTWFGIESGNERIRRDILKKNVSDEAIIKTASILKRYKIPFGTYNMIGLPGETLDNVFETIDLNIKVKADYPGCTIFQPYPRTKIFDYCLEHNYLDRSYTPDDLSTMFDKITINIPDKNKIENLHKFFIILVKYPWLRPLVKKLIQLKPNKLYQLIFMLTFADRQKKSFNVGLWNTLRLGLKLKKTVSK